MSRIMPHQHTVQQLWTSTPVTGPAEQRVCRVLHTLQRRRSGSDTSTLPVTQVSSEEKHKHNISNKPLIQICAHGPQGPKLQNKDINQTKTTKLNKIK